MSLFKKAEKAKSKLRLALIGTSGSGKTFSALTIAKGMGEKIAFIDTECGSASLYADRFDFDVLELEAPYHPLKYIEAIKAAEAAGYGVIIIDSLTHAWAGDGGLLDQQARLEKSGKFKNSFASWREITPLHNRLVEALIGSKAHIICCIRAKSEYALETNDKGKVTPKKIGLAPVQREGLEFEFTIVLDVTDQGWVTASKDRTTLFSAQEAEKIDESTPAKLIGWLNSGVLKTEVPSAFSEQNAADIKACLQGVKDLESLAAVWDKNKLALARLKETNKTFFDEIMAVKDAKKAELAPEKNEFVFDEETLRQDIKIAKDIFGNFETIDYIKSLKQQDATNAQLYQQAETIKTQGIKDYVIYNMVSPEHFRQHKTTILSELDVFLLKLPNAGGLYEK